MIKPMCSYAVSAFRHSSFFISTTSCCGCSRGFLRSTMNSEVLVQKWKLPYQNTNFSSSKQCETKNELIERKSESSNLPVEISKFRLRDLTKEKIFNALFPYKKVIIKAKLLEAITLLYEDLSNQINVQEFFDVFKMPDTYASWFIVMELHIYLLSARMMKNEVCGLVARDMLTDSFWNDAIHRSHKLGPKASLYCKKQLMILARQFEAAFYGYDEGIQSNDMVLAAVIWRRFFGFECDDARELERLVKYMRIQLQLLTTISFDDIIYKRPQLIVPLSEICV